MRIIKTAAILIILFSTTVFADEEDPEIVKVRHVRVHAIQQRASEIQDMEIAEQ